MSEGATGDLARAMYCAYRAGDQAALEAIIDDDIDWIIHGPVVVFPFQGRRHGKAAVLDVLAGIAREYLLQEYQVEELIVEGDRAAALSDASFVQRATGRVVRLRLANFLRFSGGKLVEFREFMDTFDAVEQALGKWLDVQRTV